MALCFKAKRSKLKLNTLAAKPLPTYGNYSGPLVSLDLRSFREVLASILQATVRNELHSYSGVVQLSNKFVASSDGVRLAVCEFPNDLSETLIIPVKAAEALKLFTIDTIRVGQDEQNMYFIGGDTTLIARRYVRAFPPFEKLIPDSTILNFEFNRDELLNGLKSLNPLAEEKQKIMLTISGDECIMNLASQQGSGDVTIPASGADDFLPFEALLPFEFVQDFVESVRGPAIFLRCNSEKGSFLLESGKFKLIIAGSR